MRRLGKFKIYRDSQNEWRWKFISTNGRVIFQSSESYKKRNAMLNSIDIAQGCRGAEIVAMDRNKT